MYMSVLSEEQIKSFSPNLNLEKLKELYQSIYNTIKKMPLDELEKTMYNLDNIKFANTETGGRTNTSKKYLVKTKRQKTKKNKKTSKKRTRKHKRTRKIKGGGPKKTTRVITELTNPLVEEYRPQENLAPIQQTVSPSEQRECGICLEVLTEEDCGSQSEKLEHRIQTRNGISTHYFHVVCLTRWFKVKLDEFKLDQRRAQPRAEKFEFLCPTCQNNFDADFLLQRLSNNTNIQTGQTAHDALINFLSENPQEERARLGQRPLTQRERQYVVCASFTGLVCAVAGIVGCVMGTLVGGSKKKRGGESSKMSEFFIILSETLKNILVNITKWADDKDKNRINDFLKMLDKKTEEIKK